MEILKIQAKWIRIIVRQPGSFYLSNNLLKYLMMKKINKPIADIPPFYQHYMDIVPDDGHLLQLLSDIQTET